MSRYVLIAVGGAVLIGIVIFALGIGVEDTDRVILHPDDADIVALGSEVYASNCASCHGADLEGQPDWRRPGPDGRLPAPPHDETGHTWHHDGDTLFRLTKHGVGALIGDPDYATDMPIYDGVLSDEQIIAVLSYIKSTWPDEVRAAHDGVEARQ